MSNELTLDQVLQIQEAEFEGTVADIDIPEPEPENDLEPEEPQPEPIPEPEPVPEPEPEPEPQPANVYDVYYQDMVEKGLLDPGEDFDFDGSEDGLLEAARLTEERRNIQTLQSIYSSLPEEFQYAIQYAVNGGNSLKEFYEMIQPVDYDNLDITNVENQKRVIRDYYKRTTQHSDEKIENYIARLDQMDALEEEATDAVEYMSNYNQKAAQELALKQENERQAQLQAAQEAQRVLIDTIEQTELPARKKNNLKAYMFNVVKRDDSEDTDYSRALRAISANPQHRIQFAEFLLDAYDPNKGFDFSKYIKKGKTESASTLKKTLEEKLSIKSQTSTGKVSPPTQNVDWEALLKQYE